VDEQNAAHVSLSPSQLEIYIISSAACRIFVNHSATQNPLTAKHAKNFREVRKENPNWSNIPKLPVNGDFCISVVIWNQQQEWSVMRQDRSEKRRDVAPGAIEQGDSPTITNLIEQLDRDLEETQQNASEVR
jgi:hypothetical protein